MSRRRGIGPPQGGTAEWEPNNAVAFGSCIERV
jgi:hypothetical protein